MLNWLEKHLAHAVTVPFVLSTLNFIMLMFESLQDGILTDDEIHNLIRNCSGVNMVILVVVIAIMKTRKSP